MKKQKLYLQSVKIVKHFLSTVLLLMTLIICSNKVSGQLFTNGSGVSINNLNLSATPSAANLSAWLDVSNLDNTKKGILFPRVPLTKTKDSTTVFGGPNYPIGLIIYNTSTVSDVTPGLYSWNGTAWERVSSSSNNNSWSVSGLRFTNLGPVGIPINNPGPGFLALDSNGNVIYAKNDTTSGSTWSVNSLRFIHLKPQTIPINNPGPGFLAVDSSGNVIYVKKDTSNNSSSSSWSLNGNSNLTSSHYIGTPSGTNQPMKFKVNGTTAGLIDWDQNLANTLFGFNAGSSMSTGGAYNTAVGNYALAANTGGTRNVAIGHYAMNANTNGINNSAVGKFSLPVNTTGNENTAFGANAMDQNISGNQNVAIGSMALHSNYYGSNNTAIGNGADIDSLSRTNSTALGNGAIARGSNMMVFGNTSVVSWGFGNIYPITGHALTVGTTSSNGNGAFLTTGGVWTNASDSTKKHDVKILSYGLKDIMKLHPVSYKMNGSNYQDIGFLAQEMKLVIPEIVYGEEGQMTLSYGQLTSVLVKAMQEQQRMIEQLKIKTDELAQVKEMNNDLSNELHSLKAQLQSAGIIPANNPSVSSVVNK